MSDTPSPAPVKKVDPAIKWGSIFIIALMLLSGAAVYFGSQNATDPSVNPDQPSATVDTFIADDVSATVIDVFSSAIVGGQTSESDKTVIDEQLLEIAGVQSLNSQFTQLSAEDSTLTYIANVTLEAGTDPVAFVDSVQATSLFTAPEIYFQASVQVPSTIQAQKNGAGELVPLALTQTQVQGIVSPTTQVGDSVSGRVTANFQGAQYVNAFLIETQNVSASPQPVSMMGEFSLAGLENSLTLAGSVEYYPTFSSESLAEGLFGVDGVSGVSTPLVPQLNNTLTLSLEDADLVAEDVNAFVAAHPDEFESVSIGATSFVFTLKNTTLKAAKEMLTEEINGLLLSNAPLSFNAPVTQFLVDVNASSPQTVLLADKLNAYFASLDANAVVEIYQNGSIELTALTTDTNQSYPIENGVLRVSVFPGHSVGDTVSLFINGIAIRDELVYVNGIENADPNLE